MAKKKKENLKEVVKFFFELGQLRRVPHIGFTVAGVEKVESVAEHILRAAQIGYVLADLEGADSAKVVLMCLIHDNAEARINDIHRIANRYLNYFKIKQAEKEAFRDQVEELPQKSKKNLLDLYNELDVRKTLEAKCAKDADYLDLAVSAKEYMDIGCKGAKDWLTNIKKGLRTKSAKELLKIIEKTDRNSWWQGMKRLKEVLAACHK